MKMKGEKQKSFKFLLYPGALLLRRWGYLGTLLLWRSNLPVHLPVQSLFDLYCCKYPKGAKHKKVKMTQNMPPILYKQRKIFVFLTSL